MDPQRLIRAALRADVTLIGEQHDNADHHRLQAWVLEQFARAGRRPALALEQLDLEDQGVASDAAQKYADASQLAQALEWDKSGWPAFDIYRPVFEVALRDKLPLVAVNLSRARLHAGAASSSDREGDASLVPLPRWQLQAMAEEIAQSHCGYSNETMTQAMIRMQRQRDATMAAVTAQALRALPREPGVSGSQPPHAGSEDGAGSVVLLAGLGHARRDRGVPLVLRDRWPEFGLITIALVEVDDELAEPDEYAQAFGADSLPFDYVWFTSGPPRQDPCVEFRAQLERMRSKGRP